MSVKRMSFGAGLIGLLAIFLTALAPSGAAAHDHHCGVAAGPTGGGVIANSAATIRERILNLRANGSAVTPRQRQMLRRATLRARAMARDCEAPGRARLVNGRAIPPENAPQRVKQAIRWANHIRNKPYVWGGGHGRFFDRGYDCSGAISFALRGGQFVDRPKNSTAYMGWGRPGEGRWITVYTNPGHAYVVIAGLRFDTSGTGGNGPRWHADHRSSNGFLARHPAGF